MDPNSMGVIGTIIFIGATFATVIVWSVRIEGRQKAHSAKLKEHDDALEKISDSRTDTNEAIHMLLRKTDFLITTFKWLARSINPNIPESMFDFPEDKN